MSTTTLTARLQFGDFSGQTTSTQSVGETTSAVLSGEINDYVALPAGQRGDRLTPIERHRTQPRPAPERPRAPSTPRGSRAPVTPSTRAPAAVTPHAAPHTPAVSKRPKPRVLPPAAPKAAEPKFKGRLINLEKPAPAPSAHFGLSGPIMPKDTLTEKLSPKAAAPADKKPSPPAAPAQPAKHAAPDSRPAKAAPIGVQTGMSVADRGKMNAQAEAQTAANRRAFAERIRNGGPIADPLLRPRPVQLPPITVGKTSPLVVPVMGLRAAARQSSAAAPPAPVANRQPFAPAPVYRGKANPYFTGENVAALRETASNLGVAPRDLAMVIAKETNRTFSPSIMGGAGRRYLGLIQFGPQERREYGAHAGQSFREQLKSAERFLKGRGFQPGMGLPDLYSTVLAGAPGLYNRRDQNGSVRQHVQRMEREFGPLADRFLSSSSIGATPRTAGSPTTPSYSPSTATAGK